MFNFNGGMFQVGVMIMIFMQGLMIVQVCDGGVCIDMNGNMIMIVQNLLYLLIGGDVVSDGGLCKFGIGIFILIGMNIYMGCIIILDGILNFGSVGVIGLIGQIFMVNGMF